jgi:hypothetical protein
MPKRATSGWFPDPTRRHRLRYRDDGVWTAWIADGARAEVDSAGLIPSPPKAWKVVIGLMVAGAVAFHLAVMIVVGAGLDALSGGPSRCDRCELQVDVLLWIARAAAVAAFVLGVGVLVSWVRRVCRSVGPGEDRNKALRRVGGWVVGFIAWCGLVTWWGSRLLFP